MDEKKTLTEENGLSLATILHEIRCRLWLIVVVTVIAIGAGVGYTFTVEPNYTSTARIAYRAENDLGSMTQNNINAMNAFLDTIIDFCDEGVVLDRANYYYNGYTNGKMQGATYTVQEYIESVKANDTYDSETVSSKEGAIKQSNISTVVDTSTASGVLFYFSIRYTDKDVTAVEDKLKILVFAFGLECRETIVVNGVQQGKYFEGITSEIIDLGVVGAPVSDVSKPRIVVVSAIAGLALSLILVYVLYVSDGTIKDKDELEEITGTDLMACIVKQEVL